MPLNQSSKIKEIIRPGCNEIEAGEIPNDYTCRKIRVTTFRVGHLILHSIILFSGILHKIPND